MITEAILCMALNIFHEARGESHEGKIAVAYVVHNRAKKNSKNYCNVIFAKNQFSWINSEKPLKPINFQSKEWKNSVKIATEFKQTIDISNGATHFHAIYVYPHWANEFEHTVSIGNHLFYKEKKNDLET